MRNHQSRNIFRKNCIHGIYQLLVQFVELIKIEILQFIPETSNVREISDRQPVAVVEMQKDISKIRQYLLLLRIFPEEHRHLILNVGHDVRVNLRFSGSFH